MSDEKALAAQAALDKAYELMKSDPSLAKNRKCVLGLKIFRAILDEYLEAHDLPSYAPDVPPPPLIVATTAAAEGAAVRTGTGLSLRAMGARAVGTGNPYLIVAGLLALVLSLPGGGKSAYQLALTYRLDSATRTLNEIIDAFVAEQMTERTIAAYRAAIAHDAFLATAAMAVGVAEIAAAQDVVKTLGKTVPIGGPAISAALANLRKAMDGLIKKYPPGSRCSEKHDDYKNKFGRAVNASSRQSSGDIKRIWPNLMDAARALIDCLTGPGDGGSGGQAPA